MNGQPSYDDLQSALQEVQEALSGLNGSSLDETAEEQTGDASDAESADVVSGSGWTDSSRRFSRTDASSAALVVARALQVTSQAFAASLGECRRDVPFSTLHPVISASGAFSWCCNHDPEHCSGD